jgi:hypothetical protein
MMGIVGEHSLGENNFAYGSSKSWAFIFIAQLIKFGTVIFFLLSGFLIGDKFADYTPGQYLKRRLSNTLGPWLFWSAFFILCFCVNLFVKGRMYHDKRFTLAAILDEVKSVYLYTNYWFIINFMVSITLLLIFKRYLYNQYFGLALFAITLFYCVNIHFEWMDPRHTIAILGFILFLWLGVQLRKNWDAVDKWIKGCSYLLLVLLMIISFILSVFEIQLLQRSNSVDPYNTLRISNVIYSLVVFAFLLKIKEIKLINYLRPRATTYGIYLIHYIILIFLIPEIFHPMHLDTAQFNLTVLLLFKLLTFVLVYGITWLLVVLLNNSPAKRLVGN